MPCLYIHEKGKASSVAVLKSLASRPYPLGAAASPEANYGTRPAHAAKCGYIRIASHPSCHAALRRCRTSCKNTACLPAVVMLLRAVEVASTPRCGIPVFLAEDLPLILKICTVVANSYFLTFLACITRFSITPSNASLSPMALSMRFVQYVNTSSARSRNFARCLT